MQPAADKSLRVVEQARVDATGHATGGKQVRLNVTDRRMGKFFNLNKPPNTQGEACALSHNVHQQQFQLGEL